MKSVRYFFNQLASLAIFTGCLAVVFVAAGSFHVWNAMNTIMPLPPLALGVTSNSPGTLSGELIIRRALQLAFTKFPRLNLIAKGFKDFDGNVSTARLGQTVRSRIQSLPTVGNFGDSSSAYSATDVPGALSNFRQIQHTFGPAEINATDRNLIEESATPMAVALARSIVRNQAALVCNSNFNTTVNSIAPTITVASGWTRANTILPMQTAADERGIPEDESQRFFVVNSTVAAGLLGDTVVVAELNNPANGEAIKTGKLPMVSGFQFDTFPQLPNTDGNLIGFAGAPDALLYIARAPDNPANLIPGLPATANMAVITDENSGFSVLAMQYFDAATMEVTTRLLWLDGLAVGNPGNLVRLVSGVIAGTSGTMTKVTVTNPGYAYKNGSNAYTAPTVGFSGGGGSSAAGTATISNNGAVTAVGSLTAGSGYTSAPAVAFTPASSGTTRGVATAVATIGGLL